MSREPEFAAGGLRGRCTLRVIRFGGMNNKGRLMAYCHVTGEVVLGRVVKAGDVLDADLDVAGRVGEWGERVRNRSWVRNSKGASGDKLDPG